MMILSMVEWSNLVMKWCKILILHILTVYLYVLAAEAYFKLIAHLNSKYCNSSPSVDGGLQYFSCFIFTAIAHGEIYHGLDNEAFFLYQWRREILQRGAWFHSYPISQCLGHTLAIWRLHLSISDCYHKWLLNSDSVRLSLYLQKRLHWVMEF
jgi:hypothetical protein